MYGSFNHNGLGYCSKVNSSQTQLNNVTNVRMALANDVTEKKQQLSSLQVAQATELAALYADLSAAANETQRDAINAEIKKLELQFQAEEDEINREVTEISIKENAFDLEQKALETEISVWTKQLEANEEAKSAGIEKATPKYSG